MIKYQVLQDIKINQNTYNSSRGVKLVEASDEVYSVDEELAQKANLFERFNKYPKHIKFWIENEDTEETPTEEVTENLNEE